MSLKLYYIKEISSKYFLTDTTRLWLGGQFIGKSSQLSEAEVHNEECVYV